MSKSLTLSNGVLTVGLDQFAQVKDCYFDYVGLENQMGEQSVNRIGIWVDGVFSWFSDNSWYFDIDYQDESLTSDIIAKNSALNIEITLNDCIYNEKPILVRSFTIKNLGSEKKKVKLFLNHEFEMYRTPKGDTVYFDPNNDTIVHYKGRRIAIIGGLSGDGEPFSDYTVGLCGIEGKEGTWRDAEDGILSKNEIEHGNVDSTICFENDVSPLGTKSVVVWVSFAKTMDEARALHIYTKDRGALRLSETTKNYWKAWSNKVQFTCFGLSDEIKELFKKSLLILRTHVGELGEVIASIDSDMLQWGRDNYNYVWPRDGAYVALAFDKAGYSEVSRKFFEFCNVVIGSEGYFLHKYRPDKSLGSSWHGWVAADGKPQLPIQEDETAIVLIALWTHFEKTKDLEFIEKIYNSLIKKAANFLIGFRSDSKLPLASFDLWEMKMGVHTYTVATVYESLLVASRFANLLGKEHEEENYKKAAEEVKREANTLWNKETNFFVKSLNDPALDISAFYGAWKFNLFSKETLNIAYKTLNEKLTSNGKTGGLIRFENDAYFRNNVSQNGNPWIVTTLWKAQYLISKAEKEEDLLEVKEIFEWVKTHALKSGILSEQLDPETGFQLSASPLAWSHAEFVTTVISYMEKLQKLGICEVNYVPLSEE